MRKLMKLFIPMLLAVLVLLPVTQADEVAAASQFEDGEYGLSMTVLSEGGGSSVANDYISNSAKLIVKDGKNTLHLTVAQEADMVKAATVGGTKGSKNGSTFTFSNIELSQSMNGNMHVVVPKEQLPPNGYDKNHTVTYQFSNLSDVPTKDGASEEATESNDNAEGTPAPEENPPTGDNAPILFLTVVLLGSGIVLVRKVAVK